MADIRVRVGTQESIKIRSAITGNVSFGLSELVDVNTESLSDGMVLIYNGTEGKWKSSAELDGGSYWSK